MSFLGRVIRPCRHTNRCTVLNFSETRYSPFKRHFWAATLREELLRPPQLTGWNPKTQAAVKFMSDGPTKPLLPLTDLPEILWPRLLHSIRNWILATFVIRPYMDRDFSLRNLTIGAKQALVCVSQLISRGEFEGLKDLLSPECISEVSKNLSNYSLQDRHMLAVAEDDIYFAFPYQIGMIIEDDPPPKLQRRWVEVTMCYHVFLGMGETIRRGEPPPTPGDLQRNREKLIICNYRFIRNYTKGVNDDWTINKLNHFRPSGFS